MGEQKGMTSTFPKQIAIGLISHMTEDLEMGSALLRLSSAAQELGINVKAPPHGEYLLYHFFMLRVQPYSAHLQVYI